MRTLIIALSCFSGLCAFAFLLAGEAALLALDEKETEDLTRRAGKPPSRGVFRIFWFIWAVAWRADLEILRCISTHWKARKDARVLIRVGLAFLAVTLVGLCLLVAVKE